MQTWKRIILWVIVAALILSVAVCQKKAQQAKTAEKTEISSAPEGETKPEEEPVAEQEEKPAEEPEKPAEAAPAKPKEEITRDNAAAIIEMKKGGRIVIEFYPSDAPNTVDNFIKLTNKGYYDGITFHRVEPGLLVQGGDPLGDGTGGPGYTIKAEFNSQKHVRGTVAMARRTPPDTAGSQFYICLTPIPSLDGNYTVFGIVTEGMEVVDGIQVGDVMKKVTIVDKASLEK